MSFLLFEYFLSKIRAWAAVVRWPLKIHTTTPALVGQTTKDNTSKSRQLAIWQKVDSELTGLEGMHHDFWWRHHTGKALAISLHNAGYPSDLQYRYLKFFTQVVAPFLGSSHYTLTDGTPQWPSFMTDNGGPVELSWDWGKRGISPTIRYSIEPIGVDAGTSLDPGNLKVGPKFQKHLARALTNMNLDWYHHFETFFNTRDGGVVDFVQDTGDHNTSIFYAFDLSPNQVTAKSYFFPKLRARVHGKSHLDILGEAISQAPFVTEQNLGAWKTFLDFSSEKINAALEYEMLAIDHVEPLKSRLKIYFRSRETSFASVSRIMSLGGRIQGANFVDGLADLARLWKFLFEVDKAPNEPLANVGHRTAGILYNIEFKLGDSFPVAKIYLPVRHYSSSDESLIKGLGRYFEYHDRDEFVPEYTDTIRTLFRASAARQLVGVDSQTNDGDLLNARSMPTQTRVHTYIGCTIRPDGFLRVVSYFAP